ncbi:MAG: sugar transferase [Minisyncoccota bacterium]
MSKHAKRALDLTASVVGLLALAPLLALIALLVRVESAGPVLFRQQRVGRHGRPFDILKFRTMRAAPSGSSLPLTVKRDPRITRIGTFLRKHKLDELPQLVNVIRGDMSLVGPRPEVLRYVQHWDAEARAVILSVRPGITDLASIAFRHENEMLEGSGDPEATYLADITPRKNQLALVYVRNWSFWLDLTIIARTCVAILR